MLPSREFGPVRIYAGDKNGKYPDGNQVVVQGAECRAVFDSPLVANRIGVDFDNADLVIQGHMHEDHIAGLHRVPEAAVHIHEGDLEAIQSWDGLKRAYGYDESVCDLMRESIEQTFNYVPRPDAIGFKDGHSWDLGGGVRVHAIHTPGHTAGHCVLLVEPVGVLCTGDIDLSGFGPYYGDKTSNLADFKRSLDILADVPARAWVTFHHRGVYTDSEKFHDDLAAFAGKIEMRNQTILSMLSSGPRSTDDLVEKGLLYDAEKAPPWAADAERYTVVQHLEELLADGRIIQEDDRRYRLA